MRSLVPPVALCALLAAASCADTNQSASTDTTTGDGDGDIDGGPPPTEPGWHRQPAVPGGAIQETAAVAIDGKIYVLGGINSQIRSVDAVHVFDTATGTWSQAAPLPVAVHHANAAVVAGKIYVLGSLTLPAFAPLADVWQYDPAVDEWQARQPMNAGEARGSSAVGVIDGLIYVAGGLAGSQAVANVSVYDPVANLWDDSLPDLPEIRDHAAFGTVDGVLYAIGGRRGGIATVEDTVYAFDPAVGDWQTRAPMPTARGGVASAVVGEHIVVAGGEGSDSDPGGVFPQVEAYDPADNTWTALDPMMTPRHGMGAAAVGNVFYTPGGATSQSFGATAIHEALVLPPSR